MSRVRLAVAVVALAAAVFAALLASDVRSWQNGIRNGDVQYLHNPASASWQTPTILPFHLARGILGISDQIAFRRAARTFVALHAIGCGYDNCYVEAQERANLEIALASVVRGPDRSRDSAADNLLGILAYSDSQASGSAQAAPVQIAVTDFQSAVQLDPTNTDAKFNLEWLQRQLVAHGARAQNTNTSGGPKNGRKGAAGGTPGRGY